jgi:hypothetical protein
MAATYALFGKPLESLESRLLLSQDLMFDFVAATANASGSIRRPRSSTTSRRSGGRTAMVGPC